MNNSQLSDEQLIKIIREKDQELYSQIIQRYQQKLTHYLRKFINDRDELEDVLQEVFIKAYKNLYGFNINRKFSSWIYRIAHNESINHIKKNSRIKIPLGDVEYKLIYDEVRIGEKLDQADLKIKIEQQLSTLSFKYREPLVLFYLEEKSYEEISDILRLPKSTVGTLILRGKNRLREILEKDYEHR